MKFSHLTAFALAVTALACMICTCGTSPMAGGSSDSGNARVAAVIFTNEGERAVGVPVVICPRSYAGGDENDSGGASVSPIRRTVTDDTGRFAIDSVDSGDYFVEVNDQVSFATLYEVVVPLRSEGPISISYKDTLRPFAGIVGNSGRSSVPTEKRFLLVYGTDRKIPIDSAGNFSIANLPAGTFHFRIVSSDAAMGPVDIDGIKLVSGKTLSVPFMGWQHHTRIFLNTTASGANVAGNVYGFPALVRLTGDHFNFSEAAEGGGDIGFTKSDNTPLAFEIERWDAAGGRAEIWVKIDTVFGNNDSQFMCLYWGNPHATPLSNGNAVFDTLNGFQGVWHLSETILDSARDATPNHFNGVYNGMNASSVVEGVTGAARSFDGVSVSVTIPNSSSGKLNFPEDGYYSLSAWAYADTLTYVIEAIVGKGDEQYYLCGFNYSSTGPLWKFTDFKDNVGWQTVEWPASNGQWTSITGVKKGTAQYFYINGELVDTTIDIVAPTKPRNTTFNVTIGKFLSTGGGKGDCFFHGFIDEVRIHNVFLSSDWVRLCYMNQRKDEKLVVFE